MKQITLHHGTDEILLEIPDNSIVYQSNYQPTTENATQRYSNR